MRCFEGESPVGAVTLGGGMFSFCSTFFEAVLSHFFFLVPPEKGVEGQISLGTSVHQGRSKRMGPM